MTNHYEKLVIAFTKLPGHEDFLAECARGLQERKKRQMPHPYSPAGRFQTWARSVAV